MGSAAFNSAESQHIFCSLVTCVVVPIPSKWLETAGVNLWQGFLKRTFKKHGYRRTLHAQKYLISAFSARMMQNSHNYNFFCYLELNQSTGRVWNVVLGRCYCVCSRDPSACLPLPVIAISGISETSIRKGTSEMPQFIQLTNAPI